MVMNSFPRDTSNASEHLSQYSTLSILGRSFSLSIAGLLTPFSPDSGKLLAWVREQSQIFPLYIMTDIHGSSVRDPLAI